MSLRTRVVHALTPIVLGSVLAFACWPFAFRLPNFLIPDDGYFYAQIAFHLGVDGRSTFDGIHTTSGYHLPWALVLAIVSRVVGVFTRDPSIHLLAHLAVALSILVATVRAFFDSWIFRLTAFVVLLASFSLTEMALAAPILLALLRQANETTASKAELWLASAIALVRVDLAVAPLAIALFFAFRDRRRSRQLALATIVGVALQLVVMKVAFGHFVSVAASLKAPAELRTIPFRALYNFRLSAFQLGLYGAHAALAGIAVRVDRRVLILVIASLAFLVAHTALSILRGWYWVPSLLGLLYALERAAPASRPRLVVAILAVVFVVRSIRVELVYREDQLQAAAFLRDLQRLVPRGATIFTFDNPGYLGFLSGFNVVDGDGLVNDHDYARRLREHHLAGYLDEERICHVVVDHADARPVLQLGGLVLEETAVVPLATYRHRRSPQADFVLYRLRAERCNSAAVGEIDHDIGHRGQRLGVRSDSDHLSL